MNIIRSVNLSFAKSISGFNESIQNKRFMLCTTCAGKKVQKVKNGDQCAKCYGTGENSDTVGEICN
jgi:DnaJ-class molecular chaperone